MGGHSRGGRGGASGRGSRPTLPQNAVEFKLIASPNFPLDGQFRCCPAGALGAQRISGRRVLRGGERRRAAAASVAQQAASVPLLHCLTPTCPAQITQHAGCPATVRPITPNSDGVRLVLVREGESERGE